MGTCCAKQEIYEFPTDFEYQNKVKLELFSVYGSQINELPSDNTFVLPGPWLQDNINIFLSNLPFKVSGCVIPGMEFRTGQSKTCQDNFGLMVLNNTLLAVLCDGHGTEGHHISKFALEYVQKRFKKDFVRFKHDPKAIIASVLQKCDEKIMKHMECEMSGTTVIVMFVADGSVVAGSLGDSRAVLGYLHSEAEIARVRPNKYFRKITCGRPFKIFPLTIDQKPENEDEELRIRKSGGLVQKYTDAFGRNVGPYRVWRVAGGGPGLAMSRSLGDKVAKSCGVIAQPIFIERRLVSGKDHYIVLASDGVWDVMDNIEVINFIERFKGQCLNSPSTEYPASPNNCSISRLICEEARYRWLGVAQEERVAIDDISCVVIDFGVNDYVESIVEQEGEKKMVSIVKAEKYSEADTEFD